jgi:hypothetical protein
MKPKENPSLSLCSPHSLDHWPPPPLASHHQSHHLSLPFVSRSLFPRQTGNFISKSVIFLGFRFLEIFYLFLSVKFLFLSVKFWFVSICNIFQNL